MPGGQNWSVPSVSWPRKSLALARLTVEAQPSDRAQTADFVLPAENHAHYCVSKLEGRAFDDFGSLYEIRTETIS